MKKIGPKDSSSRMLDGLRDRGWESDNVSKIFWGEIMGSPRDTLFDISGHFWYNGTGLHTLDTSV